MKRRLLLSCALVCALSPSALAGNPINPGDDPPPIICTDNCTPPDEGGTNAVAPVDGVSIIVDALLFIGLL